MSSPKFSILMPVVKTRYFKEAFDSAATQTFDDYEIVVIDNKADGDVSWVTSKKNCRLVRNEERLEAVPNWNKGLVKCQGEYILLLSDDDILLPECLTLTWQLIKDKNRPSIIRIMRENIDVEGKHIGYSAPGRERESPEEYIYNQCKFRRGQVISDIIFKRTAALEVGGFKPLNYAWGADHLLAIELAFAAGFIYCFNEALLKYRVHGASMSSAKDLKKIRMMMAADNSWTDMVLGKLEKQPTSPYRDNAAKALHATRQDMQDLHYYNAAECGLINLMQFHWSNSIQMGSSRRSLCKAIAFVFSRKLGLSKEAT